MLLPNLNVKIKMYFPIVSLGISADDRKHVLLKKEKENRLRPIDKFKKFKRESKCCWIPHSVGKMYSRKKVSKSGREDK